TFAPPGMARPLPASTIRSPLTITTARSITFPVLTSINRAAFTAVIGSGGGALAGAGVWAVAVNAKLAAIDRAKQVARMVMAGSGGGLIRERQTLALAAT